MKGNILLIILSLFTNILQQKHILVEIDDRGGSGLRQEKYLNDDVHHLDEADDGNEIPEVPETLPDDLKENRDYRVKIPPKCLECLYKRSNGYQSAWTLQKECLRREGKPCVIVLREISKRFW